MNYVYFGTWKELRIKNIIKGTFIYGKQVDLNFDMNTVIRKTYLYNFIKNIALKCNYLYNC